MVSGRVANPVSRSVPAKEVNSKLLSICSLCLVFTAIITKAFVTMIAGKLSVLKINAARVTEWVNV